MSEIQNQEKMIAIIQAGCKITSIDTGAIFWEGAWGREGAKGYLRGRQSFKNGDNNLSQYDEVFAFDGEKLRTFQPGSKRGSIRELKSDLDMRLSPGALLGQSLI